MMRLLAFVRLTTTSAIHLVVSAVVRASVAGVPPRNWIDDHSKSTSVPVGSHHLILPCRAESPERTSRPAPEKKVKCTSRMNVAESVYFQLLLPDTVIEGDFATQLYMEEVSATPPYKAARARARAQTIVEAEFSISSPLCPSGNATYIAPIRSPYLKVLNSDEVEFNLLKAASERVSEILRENRRKLDAGEDTCTIRREARRRRAQELSAHETLVVKL